MRQDASIPKGFFSQTSLCCILDLLVLVLGTEEVKVSLALLKHSQEQIVLRSKLTNLRVSRLAYIIHTASHLLVSTRMGVSSKPLSFSSEATNTHSIAKKP